MYAFKVHDNSKTWAERLTKIKGKNKNLGNQAIEEYI